MVMGKACGPLARHCVFLLVLMVLCDFLCPRKLRADTVTFGSGSNSFTLTFRSIGDEENPADSYGAVAGFGSVSYSYDMSKYEISQQMIDVYNSLYGTDNGLLINYYEAYGICTDEAATGITWNEAARFVNWLNIAHGAAPAYRMQAGIEGNIDPWTAADVLDYDSANPYRSRRAIYALPTRDEWHKAAFYNQTLRSGTGWYNRYATGLDTAPTPVASGTLAGTVVYAQEATVGPAPVTEAGGLSYYGIMAMNGNASEWMESPISSGAAGSFLDVDYSSDADRYVRGGAWFSTSALSDLRRTNYLWYPAGQSLQLVGFRVVRSGLVLAGGGDGSLVGAFGSSSVPEPGTAAGCGLLALASGGRILRRRLRASGCWPFEVRAG
jgi:formylglycine-generating enzyme required for sulfatase activity